MQRNELKFGLLRGNCPLLLLLFLSRLVVACIRCALPPSTALREPDVTYMYIQEIWESISFGSTSNPCPNWNGQLLHEHILQRNNREHPFQLHHYVKRKLTTPCIVNAASRSLVHYFPLSKTFTTLFTCKAQLWEVLATLHTIHSAFCSSGGGTGASVDFDLKARTLNMQVERKHLVVGSYSLCPTVSIILWPASIATYSLLTVLHSELYLN